MSENLWDSQSPLLQELLNINMQQNLQLVVQVAKEYTEQLGANKIIELLETHRSYHGLYYYLGSSIAFSEDPEVSQQPFQTLCQWTPFIQEVGLSHECQG